MDRNMRERYTSSAPTKRRLANNKQAMKNAEAVRRALKCLVTPWTSLFGPSHDEGQKVLVASLVSTLEAENYAADA